MPSMDSEALPKLATAPNRRFGKANRYADA